MCLSTCLWAIFFCLNLPSLCKLCEGGDGTALFAIEYLDSNKDLTAYVVGTQYMPGQWVADYEIFISNYF